jgi:hypothetical protein
LSATGCEWQQHPTEAQLKQQREQGVYPFSFAIDGLHSTAVAVAVENAVGAELAVDSAVADAAGSGAGPPLADTNSVLLLASMSCSSCHWMASHSLQGWLDVILLSVAYN